MRSLIPLAVLAAAIPVVAGAQEGVRPGIGMAQAIDAAEAVVAGGRTVDAEFEREDGRGRYEITILTAENAQTVVVDAQTGRVLDRRDESFVSELLEYRPPPVGGETALSLADAVRRAEQAVRGRAVEAEIDRNWRGDRIEVELRGPQGDEVEVEMSALNGAITEVD